MNNQEFLDELGRRARDVTEQAGQWGASLVALIEQELQEGNEMALGPIGILEVRKEAEYIALHPVTGQRMLVPPRLVVHFRPETGSQPVLAQRFAVRQDIPQELADGFVRQFICLVEDGLQADQYVRVKGLGTFKRMSAGREWKVIFQPDTALIEAVNKPFSHFETVMLKDSTHYSDLEEPATQASVPVVPDVLSESEDASQPAVIAPPAAPSAEAPAATLEEPLTEPERSVLRLPWCMIAAVLLVGVLVGGGAVWSLLPAYPETDTVTVAKEAVVSDTFVAPKDTLVVPKDTLVALQDSSVAPEPSAFVAPKDRVGGSSIPVARPSAIRVLSDSVSYRPKGVRTTHTLRPGESLVKLAKRYYGNKNLWTYLVKFNQDILPDANQVPVGLTLRIPELEPVAE